jgi:hypothetical protein
VRARGTVSSAGPSPGGDEVGRPLDPQAGAGCEVQRRQVGEFVDDEVRPRCLDRAGHVTRHQRIHEEWGGAIRFDRGRAFGPPGRREDVVTGLDEAADDPCTQHAGPAGDKNTRCATTHSMKYCSGLVRPGVRQVTESRIDSGTLRKLFLTTP